MYASMQRNHVRGIMFTLIDLGVDDARSQLAIHLPGGRDPEACRYLFSLGVRA